MATEKFDLTDTTWTDLGPMPCIVQSVVTPDQPVAAPVALVLADAAPADLEAPAHALGSAPVTLALAGRVFARAVNGRGARVVVSR